MYMVLSIVLNFKILCSIAFQRVFYILTNTAEVYFYKITLAEGSKTDFVEEIWGGI